MVDIYINVFNKRTYNTLLEMICCSPIYVPRLRFCLELSKERFHLRYVSDFREVWEIHNQTAGQNLHLAKQQQSQQVQHQHQAQGQSVQQHQIYPCKSDRPHE